VVTTYANCQYFSELANRAHCLYVIRTNAKTRHGFEKRLFAAAAAARSAFASLVNELGERKHSVESDLVSARKVHRPEHEININITDRN
jgi:hypothetical protein